MCVMYKLESANKNDIELLVSYKLKSIIGFDKNMSKEEITRITNFVKTNIPKQIDDYKVIKVNDKTIGCLFVEKYEDGVLLNEIYLDEYYRNKGIGRDLITNIIKNNSKVYLWVYKNNENAVNLYKKLNFKIKNSDDNRYFMCYEK